MKDLLRSILLFHSNDPKQELIFERKFEETFPLLLYRNKIKWKTPKLCFNVLKSWQIDSNELNQGALLPFRSRHLAHHSLARHLLPIYCCYVQNILYFSNFLAKRRRHFSFQHSISRCEQQIEVTQLNSTHNYIMKTIDKFALTTTPFSQKVFLL